MIKVNFLIAMLLGPSVKAFSISRSRNLIFSHSMTSQTIKHRGGRQDLKLQSSASDENNDDDDSFNDSSWIQDAMNLDPKDVEEEAKKEKYRLRKIQVPLKEGIAGFAVDPDLGFVCILAPMSEEENYEKFSYVIISPTDTEKLSSAEALCLVQLSGGLDLGAAVFPPETLAKIVANEMILQSDDDEEEEEINIEELRAQVRLLGVTALRNEKYEASSKQNEMESDESIKDTIESSPEREEKIESSSPQILAAIQKLPGLQEVTLDKTRDALRIHADEYGSLSRQGFSELLDTLRTGRGLMAGNGRKRLQDQPLKLRITATISKQSNGKDNDLGLSTIEIDHVPAFQAIGLALRYKSPVTISDDCFSHETEFNGFDEQVMDVYTRFPAFKPIQELVEDAKVMDGFISSMFFKQSAPENDDKA